MATKGKAIRIYTIVEVWRGIAQGARSYRDLKSAERYMRRLRRTHNNFEDDVQMFQGSLRISR